MIDTSGDDLLKIPQDKPEQLFSSDPEEAKRLHRKLVSKWHPDQNPTVDERVMAHVNVLYELAVFRIATDTWVIPGAITFKTVDGKKFQLKYRSHRQFELGDIYVGDNLVAYSLFKDNEDLYKNAKSVMKNFKFADDKMKDEIKKLLPEIKSELETDDRLVMLIKKTPDQLLLSDVLDHYKKSGSIIGSTLTTSTIITAINSKHVAWMVSRLFNLACYLKYSKLVHSGITLDSCFVSPEFHTVSLLGGWWYASEVGKQLKALPAIAVEFAPQAVLDKQLADPLIDLELVRAVGRELLVDKVGSKLIMNKNLPAPMVNWLREPAKGDAYEEFNVWQNKILVDSFGPRRYVELKLSAEDIYGNNTAV